MRILITNNSLDERGGSELYVRDLANGLLERGHTPIVYSTILGEVAKEIRAATIPVIDNLDSLGLMPDIIHGQHHLETMTALLRFPGVPAVSFCHGWLPWEESPPRFPRILQYVAVDQVCRDRLILECGISADRVRVLLNFVDLERFKPRGSLPDRPQRALIFSNHATESTQIPAVREACERYGIILDIVGLDSGNVCAQPEDILGDYDLVFAKGRAALESLAVGAAVVLCDARGVGPMVTTSEFDRLRPLNFGLRTLRDQVRTEVIDRQIARYDAVDAAKVSSLVRAVAGRDAVVDQIISMYREVIEENESIPTDEAAEAQAAASYLRWLAPTLKSIYSTRNRALSAEAELAQIKGEGDRLRALILERDKAMQDLTNHTKEREEQLAHCLALSEETVGKLTLNGKATANQLEEVTRSLSERGAELDKAASSLEEKEAELARTMASLAESESQLDRIKRSLGWRLLSRYGRIKHGVLLPAFRVLKSEPARGNDQWEASPTPSGAQDYSGPQLLPAQEMNQTTMHQVFSDIYHQRAWGEDCESVSGPGSSVARTAAFRDDIAVLLKEINVRTLLDAGCGDFNWMKLVKLDLKQYIGIDVVPQLISDNQRRYGNAVRSFLNLDLSREQLPKVDLIISRDCLVHFSFKDIFAAMKNFRESHATYLLTTTFSCIEANKDIETGGWRYLNLQMPPFNFPEPLKLIQERRIDSDGLIIVKYLGLWPLRDIPLPPDQTNERLES